MDDVLKVYPTRLAAEEAIRNSFLSPGRRSSFSDDIISINRFENRLIEEYVPFRPIGDVERWLFLHDAVSAEKSLRKNPFLSALTSSDGFVRSIGELIQQLKLGLVKSGDLSRIAGFASAKEKWIKKVFERYERSLKKRSLYDTADIRRMLIERLSGMKESPRFLGRFREIHFIDIYHYTPFRFELIYLLGRQKQIVVHFPLPDERRKAFDFVERDIQKFQSLEDSEGNIELAFDDAAQTSNSILRDFSGLIFSENRYEGSEDLSESIEITRNSSRYREIEEAASRILYLRKGGWSDFCLVFRNLESYGVIVEDVFRRAGIPVYLRRGIPVRHNPYVRTLLGIFRAVETDFDRDEIAKLITSDYFSFLPKNADAGLVEKLLLKAGIINGPASYWRKRIKSLPKKKLAETPGSYPALKKVVRLLLILEKFGRTTRASACLELFNDALKLLSPKPLKHSDPFSIRDLFCRSRFNELLDEIASSLKRNRLGDSQLNWKDLRRLLVSSLGNIPSPDWSDRNHVYALNVHELAGRKFPYLFVCGLHDGEFPQRTQQGSILTESEKKEFNEKHAETLLEKIPLRKRGRQVFSRLGESWEEESFLFYLASRSASKKLFLSYSTHDLNGEELGRSSFLEDAFGVFPQLEYEVSSAVALEKGYSEQIDRAAREAKLLRDLFSRSEEEAGALRSYFRYFANRPVSGKSFRLSCERSRIEKERMNFYSEFNVEKRAQASNYFTGNVGKTAQVEVFFKKVNEKGFSPTSLERYSSCPFRYFMDKPLECLPLALPQAEVERTLKGEVIHKVLEKYYPEPEEFEEEPALPSHKVRLRKIMETAELVFKEYEKKGIAGDLELWKITKEQIERVLRLFVLHEEELFKINPFVVIFTELSFGTEKGLPVDIEINGRKIGFSGKMDRVDYIPGMNSLRVFDYKYTTSLGKYSRLLKEDTFGSESFQVPIYILAALKSLSGDKRIQEVKGASASYFSLKKEPKISGYSKSAHNGITSFDFLVRTASGESFSERVWKQVLRMESGDFSVTPRECVFCRFRRVCRYQEVWSVAYSE